LGAALSLRIAVRVSASEAFVDLKVANLMSSSHADLEIRGAGAIIGKQQSGEGILLLIMFKHIKFEL